MSDKETPTIQVHSVEELRAHMEAFIKRCEPGYSKERINKIIDPVVGEILYTEAQEGNK